MTEPTFDPEAVIDAMAPLLALDVRPEYREGVATNLRITARFAALMLDAELGDHAEPAALFVPESLPETGSAR